ncbi:Glycosyl transferase, family 2 [Pseudooceanicola batsensis HTCC2597]|uniref:Glycosyl transferase, family 2 n=1 Tax=Pseudooceanicola batsensis (strain ATCC BAA-863 / DSM 15984 / KCTC 12145 / HTCC2597) TaxID=252305 RepID=A3TTM2_PSEBH|nr:glycosyltransferase family 2 protein [Pseudooceanicola batsensis]EAQ04999.1 Glycosyl transferase, family 2 [Pseudooceanicola batsensis HTCC2597]
MSSQDLYNLDGRPRSRAGDAIGSPGRTAPPDHRPEPRPDPAVLPFIPPGPADRPERIADLRADHAEGRLTGPRLLTELAALTGAQPVDLGLTPADPGLARRFDGPTCLRHECLPWRQTADTIWIATARPERFDRALADLMPGTGPHPPETRMVLADRSAIQSGLAKVHGPELQRRMVTRTAPELSARHWSALDRAGLSVLALAVLAAILISNPAALARFLVAGAILALVVASVTKLSAAITHLLRPERPPPPCPEHLLPVMSILVPLYREDRVASVLPRRLERLDYPRARLDVIFVLEESDDVTRAALAAAALPPWIRIVTVPDGQPRTKPRAMNYALDFCIGDIIGIYDAEDAPEPDQLRKVAAGFAAASGETACLQGALDYYNAAENWITRCFTIEYNTWFRLVMPGMAKLGFAVPLGGTTAFFRRDALEAVGAWDAHNVTEDADLGMRLARAGYRTRVIDTATGEEASARPVSWVRQRSRWLKGYLMTYAVHMRRPRALLRDLGPWQFLGFQAHFLTAILHFALAPLLWLFWLVIFGVDLPLIAIDTGPAMRLLATAFLGFELLVMTLGAIATRGPRHRFLWPWIPSLHLYWPMGTLAMWKALVELACRPFYWDKTEHGHTLTEEDQPTVPIAPESSLSRVTKAFEM